MIRALAGISSLVAFSLLLVGCGRPASCSPPEHELVRGVAEDFLILAGPLGCDVLKSSGENNRCRTLTTAKFQYDVYLHGVSWYSFNSWSIVSHSVDPNQTKAIVRGSVQATRVEVPGVSRSVECKDKVGFRMSLVKEHGAWLVDGFKFGAAPAETKP